MAITAKKIAELAGVSRGTVDRALKERSGIAESTKKRILDIAEKYEYKPNIIGKALVYSGKPIYVPVILNSIGNPFFDDVKSGILSAAEEYAGYGFQAEIFECKGYEPEPMLALLDALPADISQLVITPIYHKAVLERLFELQKRNVKIILLSSELARLSDATYIGCDYEKSGRIAGKLTGLLSNGRAQLYIINGSTQHKGHVKRVKGLCDIISREYPEIRLVGMTESDDDDITAHNILCNALKENPEIDFVFITAGGVQGALNAIREQSRNIRVCTFDETPVTRKALKQGDILATICQQPYEQGFGAIKALYETIILKNKIPSKIHTDLYIKIDQSL